MNHAEHDESIGSMLASIAAALREVSDKLDVVAARVQQEVPAFPADEDLPDQTRIRRLESWAFHASQDISRLSSRLDALDGGDGDQPPPSPRGTRSRREVREAAERAAAERGEPDTDDAVQRPPLERRHSRTDHLGDPTWPLTVAPVPRAAEDRAAPAEWTAPEEVRAAPETPAAQEPARSSDDGSTRAALAELIAALQADAGVQVTLPPDATPSAESSPEGPRGGARTVDGARWEDVPSSGHRGGAASPMAEVPPRNGYPAADTSGRAPRAALNGVGSATASSSTDAPSRNGRRSATVSAPVEAPARNGAPVSALSADTNGEAAASTGIRVLDEARPSESDSADVAPRNGSGTSDYRTTPDSEQAAQPPRNGARPIPTRSLAEPVSARARDTGAQTVNGSRHGALDSSPDAVRAGDSAPPAHRRDLDSTRAADEQSLDGSRSDQARTAEGTQPSADSPDVTGEGSRSVPGTDGLTSPAGSAAAAPVGGHSAPERDAGVPSSADAGVADPFSEEKTEVGMRPIGVERARPVSKHGDDVTVPGVVARHGVPQVRTGGDGEVPAAGDPRSAGLTAGHRDESAINVRPVNGFDPRDIADHGTAVPGSTTNGIQWTFTDEDLTTPSAPSSAGHPRNGFTGGPQRSDSSVADRGPGSPTVAPPADAPAPPTRLSAPTPDAPNRLYATDSGYLPGTATPPRPDATIGPDTATGPGTIPGSALTNPAAPASPPTEPRSALTSPAAGSGEPGTPTAPAHSGAHNVPVELPTRESIADPSSSAPGLPARSPARLSAHRTTMDAADLVGPASTSATPASGSEARFAGLTNPDAPVFPGNAANPGGSSSASTAPGTAHFDSSENTGAPDASSGRAKGEPDGHAYTGDAVVADKADFDAFTNTGAPEAPAGPGTPQRADGLTHADASVTFGTIDFGGRAGTSAPPGHRASVESPGNRPAVGDRIEAVNSTPLTGAPSPGGVVPEHRSGTGEFTGTVNGAHTPDSPATSPLRRITSDPAPPTETDAAGITVTGTFRAFDREERAHVDKLQAMLDELKRSTGLQRRDVFGPPPTDAG
ncbi:hypothetical protein [Nocardia asteroides]|uniref:hypothetical protein n=1 Tax=Nocardia asteroides TaxID=1824 RepID=UPI003421925D